MQYMRCECNKCLPEISTSPSLRPLLTGSECRVRAYREEETSREGSEGPRERHVRECCEEQTKIKGENRRRESPVANEKIEVDARDARGRTSTT